MEKVKSVQTGLDLLLPDLKGARIGRQGVARSSMWVSSEKGEVVGGIFLAFLSG